MTVINTNTAATITANALTKNERAMSQAMERLSTGQRINSAGDDAAGLAISSRMTSQINGLNMAVRNANDAISMVNTADGAYIEASNMMQRMRELAVQAASGTMGSTDRTALDTEFQALSDQIQDIGANTQWNGTNILDDTVGTTGSVDFQVGANASQTVTTDFGSLSSGATAVIDSNLPDNNGSETDAIAKVTITGTLVDGDQISFMINSKPVVWTINGTDVTTLTGNATTAANGTVGFGTTAQGYSAGYTGATTLDGGADTASALAIAGTAVTGQFSIIATGSANTESFTLSNVRVTRGITKDTARVAITTVEQATAAMNALDTAITAMNTQRSTFGAAVNRLEYASDNLANVSQNTSASRSRILDADYASETTELARTQIIQQAGTAMLSQANQAAQSVLALLK
jgi:flagellin